MFFVDKALVKQLLKIYKFNGLKSLLYYLFKVFDHSVLDKYLRGSYSQKGEDLVINKYFGNKKRGFYVDIGAGHPTRFNNTNFFYLLGWHGINIEPNPEMITLFKKSRTRDINLNIAIGKKNGKEIYYQFESSGLSTFSQKQANKLLSAGYRLSKEVEIPMCRLDYVLEKNLTSRIDFFSIDVEGFELDVLESNNWKKFRPKLICIETIDFCNLLETGNLISERKAKIDEYLAKLGYREYFHNGLNTIYQDIDK